MNVPNIAKAQECLHCASWVTRQSLLTLQALAGGSSLQVSSHAPRGGEGGAGNVEGQRCRGPRYLYQQARIIATLMGHPFGSAECCWRAQPLSQRWCIQRQ